MSDALQYVTIHDAAARLRSGSLCSTELTRACLERIERLDGALHAYITVTAEQALAEAATADAELRAGKLRGPMHGIPIAYKDIVWTAGVRTTAHSKLLANWIPTQNATLFDRLRAAGAVTLGKTALHEFAYGNPTSDEPFPAARNPWNLDYSPGSSSSGSGAAVAAGLCLGAIGTDTGGSIRHPAAVCAIVGMKPTYGRVSSFGVIQLAASLDHAGPMTRTVRDNAHMLQAMAGFDPRDSTCVDHPVPDFSAAIGQGVQGLRIGVPRGFLASVPHDPQAWAAFADALRVLADLGARVEDIEVDGLAQAEPAGSIILNREAWLFHRDNLSRTPEKYGESFRQRVEPGATYDEQTLAQAHAARERLRSGYAAVFASGVDVIVSTARENPADSMQKLYSDPAAKRPATNRMYNLTGMPSIALPMGFTREGLPLGLQFAGPHWSEPLIYRVAAAYEDATPWHARHPAL